MGKLAFGNVVEENVVCLVWMGALWCLLSEGAGTQWYVPQSIDAVSQAGNYDPVVFKNVYIKFGEDGDAAVISELPHEYK